MSLSVRGRDASRAWYGDVLGFQVIDDVHEDTYDEWVLVHRGAASSCACSSTGRTAGRSSTPLGPAATTSLCGCASRADLDEWKLWFEKLEVVHSPIVDRDYGSVLCFKDPDRIQLELFYRENHP
ncbi:MAG: VOC family protein [Actinomycetota bacterium]|nr:VOC family protein [Actinomycetota bacterium]